VRVVTLSALSLLLLSSAAPRAQPPVRPPVISQRFPKGSSRGYRGDNRCGPANMAMMARGFHRRANLSDARLIDTLDRLDDGLTNHATAPEGIVRMAAALHLRATIHEGFDGGWLRRVLERGGLVIALGRPRYLPPTEAHTGGHFVSIVGVTRKGNFIINDPYCRRAKNGHRYRVPEKMLASFVQHKPNGTLFAIDSPPRLTASR
jgi:hypothetical protein